MIDGYTEANLRHLPRRVPPRDLDGRVLPGRWFSPAEAGRLLGIGERTVRRRCARGELPCVDWQGWVIDADRLPDRG